MNLSSLKSCVLFCKFLPELSSAGLRTSTSGSEDYRCLHGNDGNFVLLRSDSGQVFCRVVQQLTGPKKQTSSIRTFMKLSGNKCQAGNVQHNFFKEAGCLFVWTSSYIFMIHFVQTFG